MSYLLALDQGTTSSRSLIIDHKGRIVSLAQKEFPQSFPASGWVEQDPNDLWNSQYEVACEALKKARLSSEKIRAIGITNQRETTILWNRKTSLPIAPAIVWQDRRTTALCESMKQQGLEQLFHKKTGLLLDPYFSATKIAWLLDNIPEARALAKKGEIAFGTVDSWLIWKLTEGKVHATDATNASRTLLYNIHTLQWDPELLNILNIPESILPEVRSSSESYGKTAPNLFSTSIPISGVAGDQQAALFGQLCFKAGMAKGTYGTGCFILMHTGEKAVTSKNKLLTTIALQMKGKTTYALEGSVFNAGTAIQWLRDNLGLIQKSSEIDLIASLEQDSGGVFFVPAFTGLGAPHWDPYARGLIVGISRGTTKGHIARAVLESIAFQAADVLHAMESDANLPLSQLRVDGGIVASDLTMQFQSDLMGIPVIRPKIKELTALGAALLAGLQAGIWQNLEEVESTWEIQNIFRSCMKDEERTALTRKWERAIGLAKGWEA